jgi:hypothetical protein
MLGNRFVQEDFRGKFQGMAFHGIGTTGYDRARKQYFSTWIDSMGTGMMLSAGAIEEGGKRIVFKGTYADPVTGKEQHTRQVLTFEGKDKHLFEMFEEREGKEVKSMELVYSRQARKVKEPKEPAGEKEAKGEKEDEDK